ncbi:GlcG/HbpS family heme-binding protein [Paenibacillus abyssi]|uniref:PduO protein n=1 Tax=Paenibacillus abyssi TaxID=1340531 RepID=A0A917CXU7_9BACL|nr:heme-binding protein [Paenibacillus abyssi]GGG01812.1 PduO protein [Paenibacillus abyssi]
MVSQGQKPYLTHEMTKKLLESCEQKAKELNIAINVTVLDDGGNLKGFIRMDGAPLMGLQISQKKAHTAVGFGIPTSDWYGIIKDQPELLHGLVQMDNMVIFGGGLPIYIDSHVVGGIGVSGGSAEQDGICAQAALGALPVSV